MTTPKPWEDFDAYQLQLKVKRLETEKRLRENWQSLRHSAEQGGEVLQKIRTFTSGNSNDLIWGPLGKLALDLIKERVFSSKK